MLKRPNYPETRREDLVETLHGVPVPDPYRWLEDADSSETRHWIEAQNAVTNAFLSALPERERLKSRLTELMNFERYGLPWRRQERLFFARNDGLQNQSVLFVQDGDQMEPRVLLDPNTLSEDGTVALSSTSVSEDGRLMAYSTASGGSDWVEWRVRNVDTCEDLPDHILWSKFSGASWAADGSGFYYSAYDAPTEGNPLQNKNQFQKLFFHKLGTSQAEDELVYEQPEDPEAGCSGRVTEDGRYLVIGIWQGTDRNNRIHVMDLQGAGRPVVRVFDKQDAQYGYLANVGTRFWFSTDKDAPLGRVVAVDLGSIGQVEEVLPESDAKMESVSAVGGRLVVGYLRDARSEVVVFGMDGTLEGPVELPGLGTASGFGGRLDLPETFFSFTNPVFPATLYKLDVATRAYTVFRSPAVAFDPTDYETKQVFFNSKDGTRIPMFLTHKKNLPMDGNNKVFLGGYGGFNIPVLPGFNPMDLAWLEKGGVVAVANLRGGGEYGNAWHDAGRLANKQNVFDDFIGAAEYLIACGYTNPKRLAIRGGSNGGLLIGACLVQRPDLYGACVPYVGVLDMLRFHKFTIGWAWVSDYGSPDDAEAFKVLLSYSPYHNVKKGTAYPPTLVVTGDHDDRVVPLHSFKFAAALQQAQGGEAPILIRVETRAGHGAGKPLAMAIEESADVFAFVNQALGAS